MTRGSLDEPPVKAAHAAHGWRDFIHVFSSRANHITEAVVTLAGSTWQVEALQIPLVLWVESGAKVTLMLSRCVI